MTNDPDHSEDPSRALVPTGSQTSLVPTVGTGQRLFTRMNTDVLRFTESRTVVSATTLRRLGRFEFCEEDYQQLQLWASQRDGVSAEDLANHLAYEANVEAPINEGMWWLVDGRIKSLLIGEEFWSGWKAKNRSLDLSSVPLLTHLNIWLNKLTELDLSKVPQLMELDLWQNKLTNIDLSKVPLLKVLQCTSNAITDLDLSNVSFLTLLFCGRNNLTDLDLSNLRLLRVINCEHNFLKELDVRNCVALEKVHCDNSVRIIKNHGQNIQVKRQLSREL